MKEEIAELLKTALAKVETIEAEPGMPSNRRFLEIIIALIRHFKITDSSENLPIFELYRAVYDKLWEASPTLNEEIFNSYGRLRMFKRFSDGVRGTCSILTKEWDKKNNE